MKKTRHRNSLGAQIVEFGAVLVLGGPLLIGLIYLAVETTHFFAIKSAMDVGARNAARALVVNYNNSNTEGTTVNFITIPNYINSPSQFTVVWDVANPPTYVTVTCSYPSGGGGGLPPFPNGPIAYMNTAFNLGAFTVNGTFTCPVQSQEVQHLL